MANNQPLNWQVPIVGPDGRPTPEFMRWAQQRLVDIDGALTEEQLMQILAGISIDAGNGLSGGGDLTESRTLTVNTGTGLTIISDAVQLADTAVTPGTYGDSTHVAQFTVDQQGRLTAAANVAIAAAGGSVNGAIVQLSSDIVSPTTPYIVNWSAEIEDSGAMVNLGTNAQRIVVPSGVTVIELDVVLKVTNSTANAQYSASIRKNETGTTENNLVASDTRTSPFGSAHYGFGSGRILVTAGDYFDVRFFCNDSTVTLVSGNYGCRFTANILK